jgi:HemY protein
VIRVVVFLALLALLAFGAAWIADRPGDVVVTWQGWRLETSVTVAAIALAAIVLFAVLFWSFVRFILRMPDLVSYFLRERRRARGWRAITSGLIAVGTGNAALAQRAAAEAHRLAADEPLALLLAAQAAQLSGESERAETQFRAMLANPGTRLLGLRGLYVEARRRNDVGGARALAEEAARSNPALPWANEAVLEFQCLHGDWTAALETVERAGQARAIDKATARRWRAVLLTAEAMVQEERNPATARAHAIEAVGLAPDLVPAAALAGRLLGAEGKLRRAAKYVETAWRAGPHPDLAEVYGDLRPGDSARDRLKRVKKLAAKASGHLESALAVARAAMEANDFKQAHAALEPHLVEPTQRVCLLMSEIEASEHADHGKAREWTARALRAKRDPAWVADGFVSERWLPASPTTGRIDAFVWAVPPPAIAGPVLEQAVEAVIAIPAAQPEAVPLAPAASGPEPLVPRREPERRAVRDGTEPVVAEPPLPDDPGPEPDGEPQRRRSLFDWLAGPTP